MEKILNQLNESQCEAVKYNEGPSLVVAGAGSGKTRVLTYKIAYLISQGMNPWNILALTFTNKAAKEMRSRIATCRGGHRAPAEYGNIPLGIFPHIAYRGGKHRL